MNQASASHASLPQSLQAVTDSVSVDSVRTDTSTTAGTKGMDGNAVQQFNEFFSEGIRLLLDGNWEALNMLFYSGFVRLLGLFLENGLKAAAAFLILYLIHRAIDSGLERVLKHSSGIEPGLQGLLQKSYRVIASVFIGAIVLGQLGVNVTALVAGLSIAGIAVGFAARDSLENFISGVTILMDRPFQVGDYIEFNDQYGQVDEITLRSTRIRTVRNEVMVLPNTEMITQQVINHTKRNTLRVDISFGIGYSEYPAEAREVVLALPEGDDRILTTPAPTAVVTEMADSSVNMALRFYIREPREEVPIRWEYTEKVREALRDADIEIPFPHRQLFLDGADGLANASFMRTNDEEG